MQIPETGIKSSHLQKDGPPVSHSENQLRSIHLVRDQVLEDMNLSSDNFITNSIALEIQDK